MSQAPRHSNPRTWISPPSASAASENAASSSSPPFIQQEMLRQTSTLWLPTGSV